MRILVTGATGYIGGRLVPRLLERGHQVRVLVRDPRRIAGRRWSGSVDVTVGDLLDPSSLQQAISGIDAAYYLVHSMSGGAAFEEHDRRAAKNFLAVSPIGMKTIYLGGLVPKGDEGSRHLRSRFEVGEILRRNGRALEFRAGPIIGSGSASFEMVRYLTERLPVMVAPRWIDNEVQPVGISDVIQYLVSALESDATGVCEIGADVLTFREMMQQYADVRGLRRLIIPVPVLAPHIAGLWVGLVTPILNRIAVPLIEGIVSSVLADTTRAGALFPDVRPVPYREAVERALQVTESGRVETRWSGAGGEPAHDLSDWEGLIRDTRELSTDTSAEALFRAFSSLGGNRGWAAWSAAWKIRGLIDRMLGGPGLRRGRRHPVELLPGEPVDFWRVEDVDPPRLLRLRAEMKLPGKAWLQWEVFSRGGVSSLVQTALFAPTGLAGTMYWYLLYPIHKMIFSDLARAIIRDAEASEETASSERGVSKG